MNSLKDSYKLRNDVEIPCVGFGTYLTPDGEIAVNAIKEALNAGYRHIDTAAVYKNEESVGKAIKESGIDRKEIFVTSKLWNSDQGFEPALRAFQKTLDKLQTDYLDLYLIHWPVGKDHDKDWQTMNRETWRAMVKLYNDGLIRAIGVSNFKPHHLDALLEEAEIVPMVNQIELHPGMNQEETVAYCREHDILVEAWGPFSQGRLFKTDLLNKLSEKYNKSVAQICLRWHLQKGFLPLPKSVTPSRIVENTQIFDFELNKDEMDYIDHLPVEDSGSDPDKVRY